MIKSGHLLTYTKSLHNDESPRRFSQPAIDKSILVIAPDSVTVVAGIRDEDARNDDGMYQNQPTLPRLHHVNVVVLVELFDVVFAEIVSVAEFLRAMMCLPNWGILLIAGCNRISRRRGTRTAGVSKLGLAARGWLRRFSMIIV
jgi:hypothetical protein